MNWTLVAGLAVVSLSAIGLVLFITYERSLPASPPRDYHTNDSLD